jgi:hypothetical protein
VRLGRTGVEILFHIGCAHRARSAAEKLCEPTADIEIDIDIDIDIDA